MDDNDKKPKNKGGRPKKASGLKAPPLAEMLTEGGLTDKKHGGARGGAGRTRRELVDVASRLDAYAYDPIKSLVKQAIELDGRDDTPSRKLRKDIDDLLLGYIAAKPRTIEHSFSKDDANPLSELFGLIAQSGRPKPPTDQDK